jgi:hypothetical protein
MNMLIRVIKVLIGILLFPVAVAASQAFAGQLSLIQDFGGLGRYFLNGVVLYLIIHLVLYKPDLFYVFGHEVAHSLACLLCGGRVHAFRVTRRGGRVSTSKSNFFIALFPYFFPVYTIAFWLIYFTTSFFRDVSAFVPQFLFIMGFTLTFHIVMTINSMKIKQSDILKTGYLFSVSLIYMLNLFLVCFILSLVFAEFAFSVFFHSTLSGAGDIYRVTYNQLFVL